MLSGALGFDSSFLGFDLRLGLLGCQAQQPCLTSATCALSASDFPFPRSFDPHEPMGSRGACCASSAANRRVSCRTSDVTEPGTSFQKASPPRSPASSSSAPLAALPRSCLPLEVTKLIDRSIQSLNSVEQHLPSITNIFLQPPPSPVTALPKNWLRTSSSPPVSGPQIKISPTLVLPLIDILG